MVKANHALSNSAQVSKDLDHQMRVYFWDKDENV